MPGEFPSVIPTPHKPPEPEDEHGNEANAGGNPQRGEYPPPFPVNVTGQFKTDE